MKFDDSGGQKRWLFGVDWTSVDAPLLADDRSWSSLCEHFGKWFILGRPGYAGRGQKQRNALRDSLFSEGHWRTLHLWKGRLIDRAAAILLYEEAYYRHIASDPDLQCWIADNFREVYDNAVSNILSGCDYSIQESTSTHLQDIAIRRVMLRLGLAFKGAGLLQVRGADSNGVALNPGRLAFHFRDHIVSPPVSGWWQAGSIEDFWQSNKVLAVTHKGLCDFGRNCAMKPVFKVIYVDADNLPVLSFEDCTPGRMVFCSVLGLGRVKSCDPASSSLVVVFRHSGKRAVFDFPGNVHPGQLRDAESLRPCLGALRRGAKLTVQELELLCRHLSPLPPDGKANNGVFLCCASLGNGQSACEDNY